MTTATVTPAIAPAILEERWRMATTRERREHEGIALVAFRPDNSKALEAIVDGIETLAARLVGEVHPDGMDDLHEVAGELLEGAIKDALFAWAQAPKGQAPA